MNFYLKGPLRINSLLKWNSKTWCKGSNSYFWVLRFPTNVTKSMLYVRFKPMSDNLIQKPLIIFYLSLCWWDKIMSNFIHCSECMGNVWTCLYGVCVWPLMYKSESQTPEYYFRYVDLPWMNNEDDNPRSCKRSGTLFKSLLFWLAG